MCSIYPYLVDDDETPYCYKCEKDLEDYDMVIKLETYEYRISHKGHKTFGEDDYIWCHVNCL